jgi:hypothetical protein
MRSAGDGAPAVKLTEQNLLQRVHSAGPLLMIVASVSADPSTVHIAHLSLHHCHLRSCPLPTFLCIIVINTPAQGC